MFYWVLLFFYLNINTESVAWKSDRMLSWNDFKGDLILAKNYPDENVALTSSGIYYKFGFDGYKTYYKVFAFFSPKQSWVKPNGKNPYHLNHEQLHFDITELYARKIRKTLSENTFYKNDNKKFEFIVKTNIKAMEEMQQLYDDETEHSISKTAQEKWNIRIKLELDKLAQYE